MSILITALLLAVLAGSLFCAAVSGIASAAGRRFPAFARLWEKSIYWLADALGFIAHISEEDARRDARADQIRCLRNNLGR